MRSPASNPIQGLSLSFDINQINSKMNEINIVRLWEIRKFMLPDITTMSDL